MLLDRSLCNAKLRDLDCHAVVVADRPAPPPQLLTLVGIFLSEFGFNSTSRLFMNERKARQELNGWEDAIGKKIEKSIPPLEIIYRDWYREWKIKQKDETSTSESSGETSSESDSGIELETMQMTGSSSDDDSEASSDGQDDADVQMKEAPKGKKGKSKANRVPTPSSLSTTSESDADDEDEKVKRLSTLTKRPANNAKQAITKPTVGAMINSLKRKAASISADTSESSSAASSAGSAYDSDSAAPALPTMTELHSKPTAPPALVQAPSASSATINGASKKPSASISSASEPSSAPSSDSPESNSETAPKSSSKKPAAQKANKKHEGAKQTPLAALSANATEDSFISNKYQNYDYAERAYKDLSVTRGKGFTKEKNKKKRGSYRGGAIDTSGGKSFKFED